MNLIIERKNGKIYNLDDIGIKTIDFEIDAPEEKTIFEDALGRNGSIDFGTTYKGRTMRGIFKLTVPDGQSYVQKRNEIFQIFQSKEEFALIDTREQHKKWNVRAKYFPVKQIMNNKGEFDISFYSSSCYAVNASSTLEPLTFRNEPMIKNLGLHLTEADYIQTTNTFKIFNPGEEIDPRELPLKIHFTGASTNLTITNNTNATEWSYNATTDDTDVILLNGIRSFKNGISVFKDTNYGVIELENGFNEFTITGASAFEVKFDFHFYYL